MRNIKNIIVDLLKQDLNQEVDRIKTKEPEYFIEGYEKEYYHNGVGWALCCEPEPIYNEEAIKEYARQNIINYLKNGDENEFCFDLVESENFINCLIDLINEL